MREMLLLRQITQSYRSLNLRNSRAAWAVVFMVITAILEMSGLSLLYLVVLALGNNGSALSRVFAPAPGNWFRDPENQILAIFAGVVLLYATKNIALYYTYRNNISFAMYYYRHLIRGLYSAYVNKPLLDFRRESSGSLANIVCTQSGRLVDGVVRPLLVMITEAFLLLAIAAVVFYVSPLLISVTVMSCVAAASAYYMAFRTKALQWGGQRMHSAAALQQLVSNTSAGIGEIRIFQREGFMTSRVFNEAVVETDMFQRLEMYQQGPRFLIESVFVGAFVSCFAVQLMLRADKASLLAGFSVVAAASFRILPSINRLVNSYSSFTFNLAPALSLMQTITESSLLSGGSSAAHERPASRTFTSQAIEVKDVSFQYPGSAEPVLRHVNITIQGGQRVGIAGASGSGKSTLIDILAGLYPPMTGAVNADSRSTLEDIRSWQAGIGYVPQVPFIMPGTIRENVVFDSLSAVDERVWAVLTKVGLDRFVAGLPEGLDAQMGERGAGMSGGQRQLLCLARALFRNPDLLLLDEPTAALDRSSEAMVLSAIQGLPRATTIVMVSHKLQNFIGFDVVYVCEEGRFNLHHEVGHFTR